MEFYKTDVFEVQIKKISNYDIYAESDNARVLMIRQGADVAKVFTPGWQFRFSEPENSKLLGSF